MCGIVAYVGDKFCKEFVMEGLSRLDYRGYDSAGFVCFDKSIKRFRFLKKAGRVSSLKKELDVIKYDGNIGMGHTRWATHGLVDDLNAHPQFNCKKNVSVVHNGIIEGFEKIREELVAQGHHFCSSTDTEVIAHLFDHLFLLYKDLNLVMSKLFERLQGAYSFVIMSEEFPDTLIVARNRSPILVGKKGGEFFVASDLYALWDKTKEICFLPDSSFAILRKNEFMLYDFSGKELPVKFNSVDYKFDSVDKQDFEHYMLKEIYEQKKVIDKTISFCRLLGTDSKVEKNNALINYSIEYKDSIWLQLGLSLEKLKTLKVINLVAAGTSWHACRIAQFFFEGICKIRTNVYLASEFCYMPFFKDDEAIFIFVSQSGETADTLQALRLVSSFGSTTIAITNVPSSTIVREAGGFLPMQAGPEISVASTKAFSSQLATMYLLANRIALEKKKISFEAMSKAEEDLFVAAEVLESSIDSYKLLIVNELASKYAKFDKFIFLGRHISYPFALEAALKLKEISYIFAQCYPAGELKHGPIALIDNKTPLVMFSCLDNVIYGKLLSNAQEVKARNGHLITFLFEGQDELHSLSDQAFIIPRVNPLLAPLAMTGLMQFFIYQITKELGHPIDKPRNLAKSVTVE